MFQMATATHSRASVRPLLEAVALTGDLRPGRLEGRGCPPPVLRWLLEGTRLSGQQRARAKPADQRGACSMPS